MAAAASTASTAAAAMEARTMLASCSAAAVGCADSCCKSKRARFLPCSAATRGFGTAVSWRRDGPTARHTPAVWRPSNGLWLPLFLTGPPQKSADDGGRTTSRKGTNLGDGRFVRAGAALRVALSAAGEGPATHHQSSTRGETMESD